MDPVSAVEAGEVRFEQTVDVVVVGLGVAGASAAVAARQTGADVLAVERSGAPGGTSANSGGLIYLGLYVIVGAGEAFGIWWYRRNGDVERSPA